MKQPEQFQEEIENEEELIQYDEQAQDEECCQAEEQYSQNEYLYGEEQHLAEEGSCCEEESSCNNDFQIPIQDKASQFNRQEIMQKMEAMRNSPAAKLRRLLSWFGWYDGQVAQYNRAVRSGLSWSATSQEKTYNSIQELDADANAKQNEIRLLREQIRQDGISNAQSCCCQVNH